MHPTSGFYDTQYKDRGQPDCRGRLKADEEGRYGYRAVVPVAYPIPGDVRSFPPPATRHHLLEMATGADAVFRVPSASCSLTSGGTTCVRTICT